MFNKIAGRSLWLFALLFADNVSNAQIFTIADGSGAGCQGVIFDSGGQGASGYSNNEDYTFTICPDVPGNAITLNFVSFNLDESGAPNTWDGLSIYDGANSGAPFLGTYQGTSLQSVAFTASTFNTSGCLTLVFQSNTVGTGVFAVTFSCGDSLCDPPTALATMSMPSPATVCAGGTLLFDGSGSFAFPGQQIVSYVWDFDDVAANNPIGSAVSHSFVQAGSHMVQLTVTDSSGCSSTNALGLEVLVGSAADFAGTTGAQVVCLGDSIQLIGGVVSLPYPVNTSVNYGDGLFLPDDVGSPFTSEMIVDQYPEGSTVQGSNSFNGICVDMEHTYMGDPVLQVTCPNGQLLMLHQQGGGGTYIGAANDMDDNSNPIPGECWHYCWSPTATNGTWVENSTTNTTVAGTPPSPALNPGTYEPVGTFDSLIGCPLNGTWTFSSTDLFGADNGFLCGWQLDLNVEQISDSTLVLTTYGAGCDSSFWSGTNISFTSSDCDSITVIPTEPGELVFTYTGINNFGCTFDTSVTITVLPESDPACNVSGILSLDHSGANLYPNPVDELLHFTHTEGLRSYSLFDTDGRLVLTGSITTSQGTTDIPLAGSVPGLYVLVVHGDTGTQRYRVLKR